MKEINKETLIDAIKGLDGPHYNLIDKYTNLKLGYYCGGMVDTWKWNSSTTIKNILKDYTKEQLKDIYYEIKNSWN